MLLERERDLATLDSLLGDGTDAGGRVVLIRGEAGIGKSALVGEFLSRQRSRAHILVGACDDLFTPQPLGPIWDLARTEPTIARALESGDRRVTMETLLDLLSRRLRPTILVIEDTQWADEATLDLIKFLGRRIARTSGVLILTFREAAVEGDHPLRQVIGDLPIRTVTRIQLERLSADAIASMIDGRPFDVADVLALTNGNPLFVAEVLSSGVDGVPASVKDSVLSRAARVPQSVRELLDLVSVIPGGAETSQIVEVLGSIDDRLEICAREGLLRGDEFGVSYRHELQRRAVEAALSPPRRRELNARVLESVRGDPTRAVHHAREAGDTGSIVEVAPVAARSAMAIESHREAVAHFETLDPHLGQVPLADRAGVLSDWAREASYLDVSIALPIVERAIDVQRELGNAVRLGRILAFAVRVYEINGKPDAAERCAQEAIDLLADLGASPDLAYALSQSAWLRLLRGDDDQRGIALANESIAIAKRVGDDATLIKSLTVKGSLAHSLEFRSGYQFVEEAHRLAEAGGHRFDETYALIHLAGLCADVRDLSRAADLTRRAMETAARYEFTTLEIHARAMLSEILMWLGDWSGAERAANEVLDSDPHTEVIGWRILATIQARRGQVEALQSLGRMWSLANESGELQTLDPAAAAVAEVMWLTGTEDPSMLAQIEAVFDLGLGSGLVWPSGALSFWLWHLGARAETPPEVPSFYGWIIDGRWREAVEFWRSRDVEYEMGLALMHGDDEARVLAVRTFEGLGAVAAASRVRRDLAARGVKVPRGPAKETREHTDGLTARQAEVLELLAEGLSNAQIADRLFISHRTAENHVGAILAKLDAPNREAASAMVRERRTTSTS